MKTTIFAKLAVAATTFLTAATLMAQGDAGQGVARVSLIHGDVSTQRGDSGDTAAAALNAPVVTGDKISTGDNSRAELQLDFANILRLDARSQANLASLTDKEIQVQISQGAATYTAFKTSEIRPEVDTTNLSVRPAKGDVSFRVEVVSPDETEVTVRKGEAEVSTPSGSTQVRKGEMIVVRGSGTEAQYKVEQARGRDDWDKWNDDRDHLIQNAESVHRTSPYYTGSQDLDAYGHWSEIPDYGSVWVPAVQSDWVPYRDGRWVWEPYYGWTWVSNEPWGWAPYHYGRWLYSDASWVWWPGPVGGYSYGRGYGGGYYRPIWAPAYVSFFGFGGGIGVGFGSFGWLPIGPCDSFRPWYGGYRGRFNQVNVTNITNVTNIYNNGRGAEFGERPLYTGRGRQYSNIRTVGTDPHIGRAVSSVPADRFGSGRVRPRGVDPASFREARMMTGNLPVVPTRESLNASSRPASAGAFRGNEQQRFFGTSRPANSQSFDRQASEVQQSIQRDGHFTPVRSGEGAGRETPARAATDGNPVNRGASNSPAERGAFSPRESPANQAGRGSETTQRGSGHGGTGQGWHRFGGPSESPANRATDRGFGGNQNAPANRAPNNSSPARRDQSPANRGQANSSDNGNWQRFPSSGNRTPNNNPPASRDQSPANRAPANAGDNGSWQRFPSSGNRSQEPARTSPSVNEPSRGGSGGWDRGPRPQSSPSYRGSDSGGSSSSGDYGRGRPTLDMRQPVVTPRSSSPAYEPRGGGRAEAPRPSGGGGRSEAPRSSGGGGGRSESRPSGGGGGHGGGRSSGGGRHN